MWPEIARPESAGGANRPGLSDLRVAAESGASLIENPFHAQAQQQLRREHLARVVHRLGPRIVFELLDEIARHHGIADDIDARLGRYADLDPSLLLAIGADKFPPLPLYPVSGHLNDG